MNTDASSFSSKDRQVGEECVFVCTFMMGAFNEWPRNRCQVLFAGGLSFPCHYGVFPLRVIDAGRSRRVHLYSESSPRSPFSLSDMLASRFLNDSRRWAFLSLSLARHAVSLAFSSVSAATSSRRTRFCRVRSSSVTSSNWLRISDEGGDGRQHANSEDHVVDDLGVRSMVAGWAVYVPKDGRYTSRNSSYSSIDLPCGHRVSRAYDA